MVPRGSSPWPLELFSSNDTLGENMGRRALRKKLARKFQVGDVVTWGRKHIAHCVVEVQAQGVLVDSTSAKFGKPQRDGRLFTFIPFIPARRHGMDIGPPEHTDMKPDVESAAAPLEDM